MPIKKSARRKPSKQKRTPRRVVRAGSRSRRQDAIALLRDDHARVLALFGRCASARGADRKERLVQQICDELELHTRLEEEIFYPAVRRAIGDDDLMDEATVEHQTAKDLIEQLRSMAPDDALYDAKTTVLSEYVKHHVKEEQSEMFPKARQADLDLGDLGEEMRARRDEIAGGMIGRLKRMIS